MPRPKETHFNFTEARIAELPFADKGDRYTVYDTTTKNLAVRVGETTKIYYLIKRVNGRKIWVNLADSENTSLKDARDLLIENMKIVNDGKNPNDEKKKLRQDVTVQQFFDDFYYPAHSLVRKTKKSQNMDEMIMRLYIPSEIKRRKMLDITRGDMERMHNRLKLELNSVYSANRALKLMRQMFYKAIDWDLPTTNPAARIKLFKEVSRDRYIKENEFPHFIEALNAESQEWFRDFVMLCLLVGQRRSNMQALRWSDISFERETLSIAKTKTGKPQLVPLSQQALDYLSNMKERATSEWIFPSERSESGHLANPQIAWRAFLKRAGIENLRMHDLRRTFASYQAMSGSTDEMIGKALGDKSPAAVSIYAHRGEEAVKKSIQNGTDAMFAAINQIKQ